MGYEVAINKTWQDLAQLNLTQAVSIRFLADEYTVDPRQKRVISLSCNVAAKDFTAILGQRQICFLIRALLEYFVRKIS